MVPKAVPAGKSLIETLEFSDEKVRSGTVNGTGAVLLFQLAGYAALATIILAKYASYPDPMNIPQAILVALCIQVPPVILVVAPVFYLQSLKRLRPVLS